MEMPSAPHIASSEGATGERLGQSISEERLRLALEAGEMGTWEYRIPEQRVIWSDTLERIHGLEPGTFGGTFEDYQRDIHPDDRAHVFETLTHTLAGSPHRLRYRIIRPDGVVRWVEARGTLIRDAECTPLRITGICMDVTEREEDESETRNILNAITDPFVVHDRDWRFRYVNHAATRIFAEAAATTQQSPIGKSLWELYPDLVGTRFEREMRRAQEERVPVIFEELYAPRGTWSEQRCYPLPGGGVATIWKDTTEQKRAEEREHYLSQASTILTSSLEYKATVSQLAQLLVPKLADWCGVQLLDENGTLQQLAVAHVDPAKVEWAWTINRRYPVDMSATTGVPNVLRTGKSELYVDISDAMLEQAALDADHLQMLRALGMTSVLLVPLKARDRVIGAMSLISAESGRRYTDAEQSLAEQLADRAAVAIDNARLFTESERSRAEAHAANRSKADFLAHMSHELRTPLNAIAGYSELMELGLHGPLTPEQFEDIRRIKRSQRHLLSLINDVLNFAKLEAAHVHFDINPVSVRDAVSALEALIAPQVETKSLRYEIREIDPSLCALADSEKMQQILLNLLSNAIKFTDGGGRITIAASHVGKMVCIEVKDTGCGIPQEKHQAVFEPFVQLERTLSSAHQGTGLGLAISRDLARGMHGELTVSSVVGQGSSFSLVLPAAL